MTRAETFLLPLGTAAASTVAFAVDDAFLLCIAFPFVMWAAMRRGRVVTAICLIVLAAVATVGMLADTGFSHTLDQSPGRAWAEIVGFMLTMTVVGLAVADAAERRRSAQSTLARERDFVSTLLDSLADGVIACDADGNLTRFNERAREMHDLPGAPVPAGQWAEHYDLYRPGTQEHQATEELPLIRALHGERVHDAEIDIAPRKAPRITASVSGQPIRGPGGDAVGAVIVVRDITQRKRVEAALLEAEQRWRKTFSESPVAMALVSPDLKLGEVNSAFSELTGYGPDELAAMTPADITHPADVRIDVELAQRVFNGEIPHYDVEKRYITRNRRQVWVHLTASVVRDGQGTPLYGINVVRDITERKHFEDQLRHLADHDALTGLFNRHRLDQELERRAAESRRYDRRSALLLVDLDDFKRVNDTLGHRAGDELLKKIATGMQQRLRSSDTLARMGGDEFAAILPEASVTDAQAVAEALRRSIHSARAPGSDLRTTASIGIALQGNPAKNGEQLLVEADLALYAAKRDGGNMYFVYDSRLVEMKRRA